MKRDGLNYLYETELNTATRAGCKGKMITIHFFTSSLTTLAFTIGTNA